MKTGTQQRSGGLDWIICGRWISLEPLVAYKNHDGYCQSLMNEMLILGCSEFFKYGFHDKLSVEQLMNLAWYYHIRNIYEIALSSCW